MNLIDNIIYGNPNQTQIPFLCNTRLLEFTKQIKDLPFPPNSSLQTKTELQRLVQMQNSMLINNKNLNKYLLYNEKPSSVFEDLMKAKVGKNYDSIIKAITKQMASITLLLKYKYQRARPYQLAAYYGMPLYPYPSISAQSPSYPSGHAMQSYALAAYLSEKEPSIATELFNLAEDVSNSRMYLGLHYPSDIAYGISLANNIIKSNAFLSALKG